MIVWQMTWADDRRRETYSIKYEGGATGRSHSRENEGVSREAYLVLEKEGRRRERRCGGRLGLALEQVSEMGEGREGRRSILLPARRRLTRHVAHLIPLVLIVVAVETEQLPVAPVGRIVVVVVVLVMDRELAQLLTVKFASAVRTDPGKHFERCVLDRSVAAEPGCAVPCEPRRGWRFVSCGILQQVLARCSKGRLLHVWSVWFIWFL